MSTLTTIQSTDVVSASRAVINSNFAALNTDKAESLSDLGLTNTAAEINTVVSRNLSIPSGVVMMSAIAGTPDGWLKCQGQTVSRTTYAALFAAISTTYGVGDGSTTFNLPNLQGRVPVGFDSIQTEFDTLGETGGAKTHTLTTAEMPAHTHAVSSQRNTGGGTTRISHSNDLQGTILESNTSSAGSGEAHNNLQPYITLHYIIKI